MSVVIAPRPRHQVAHHIYRTIHIEVAAVLVVVGSFLAARWAGAIPPLLPQASTTTSTMPTIQQAPLFLAVVAKQQAIRRESMAPTRTATAAQHATSARALVPLGRTGLMANKRRMQAWNHKRKRLRRGASRTTISLTQTSSLKSKKP